MLAAAMVWLPAIKRAKTKPKTHSNTPSKPKKRWVKLRIR
jgi:hypothetical protein